MTKKKWKTVFLVAAIAVVAALMIALLIFFLRSPQAPVLKDNYKPKSKIICIDPGHGGTDPGAVNGDRTEASDNLALALLVEDYLHEAGYTPLLTRKDDTYLTLGERCTIANDAGAAYFVSLHRNSAENGKGTEIWISSANTAPEKRLAQKLLKALDKVGIQSNRGVKSGTAGSESLDYAVNKNTKMPSCIIELGFISNDEDNRLLDENLDRYAKAIAQCIDELMKD